MKKNKVKPLKIEIAGYDVGTIEETVKLVREKLVQLKLNLSGPIPFPNDRLTVTVPTSPHKHKDAQEKYTRLTHRRKFFVPIPDNFSSSAFQSLLNLEAPGKVNLRFVLPSKEKGRI
ncbi:MAG: hypothetical protein I3273_01405 [Candidatus Moeniiplasma glomeromycotorum]|nr:hypothetical protein [Candidatus Moeniiplasma glomeromycotorum]MCE8167221.1 hypothetical protein [Candidatus Moeniiplasma glomeromycotorum]MCE8168766.1 hypothetical protein [Candidatus Moeniiplasma glomeromycotorum]